MLNVYPKKVNIESLPGIVTIGEEKEICTMSENFLRMCESNEVSESTKSVEFVGGRNWHLLLPLERNNFTIFNHENTFAVISIKLLKASINTKF